MTGSNLDTSGFVNSSLCGITGKSNTPNFFKFYPKAGMFTVFFQEAFWLVFQRFLFSNTSAGPGLVLGSQHAKSKESTKVDQEFPDLSRIFSVDAVTCRADQPAGCAEDSLRWLGKHSDPIGYFPLLCQPIIDEHANFNRSGTSRWT